jgi:adenosylcobinamide-GDP ribazoletransferase
MRDFWRAVGFLTTLPAPSHELPPDGLRRAAYWFPVIGLLLGAALAGSAWVLAWIFPPTVAAVLVIGLWVALTGALHLDGLADCGDGLLPPVARERRLEIMRDPRVGAFGVTAVVIGLMLKAAGLMSLPVQWPALLLAPIWARWLLLVAAQQPSARSTGMGASLGPKLDNRELVFVLLLPATLTGLLGWWQWPLILAAGAAMVAGLAVVMLAQRRLGGVTGDVYGAVVEVSEMIFLCVATIQWF